MNAEFRSERKNERTRKGPPLPEVLNQAPCSWFLTFVSSPAAPAKPVVDAARDELRALTQDASLQAKVSPHGGHLLEVTSSWAAYFEVMCQLRSAGSLRICGCAIAALEPAFNSHYRALCTDPAVRPVLMENFVHAYGPLFLKAVRYVRAKIHDPRLPSEEELLLAVWEHSIERIENIVQKYDPNHREQSVYIFVVAQRAVYDFLRSFVKKHKLVGSLEPDFDGSGPNPHSTGDALKRSDGNLLESRDLLRKLLAEFSKLCNLKKENKKPGDLEFFQEHFLREVPKDEMCKKYGISAGNFDRRVFLIRSQLKTIVDRWLKGGN